MARIITVRFESKSMPSPDDPVTLIPYEGDIKHLDAAVKAGSKVLTITEGACTRDGKGRPVWCFLYHLVS